MATPTKARPSLADGGFLGSPACFNVPVDNLSQQRRVRHGSMPIIKNKNEQDSALGLEKRPLAEKSSAHRLTQIRS